MESCEVLIVGGGPAGSTCAAGLVAAGLDVLLLDRDDFPRVKPCAGWITPAVLQLLRITPAEYGAGRLLAEISGFRTSMMGKPEIVTRYDEIVSYGIRRDEFDHYLLQRSGVRRRLGARVKRLERQDGGWLVNGEIKAKLLVGAGGHFCPVARQLGARLGSEAVVLAQVAEAILTPEEEAHCRVSADTPALFFTADLAGYGWLFRKGNRLNIGLGRDDRQDFNRHFAEFRAFLVARGELPADFRGHFQGHAYCLAEPRVRRCVDAGALLIGDSAGLAAVQSGEGILPAIESALLAAATIVAAQGDYRKEALAPYATALGRRCGRHFPSLSLPPGLLRRLGACLLANPWATRLLVLNRWFLHAGSPEIAP
jgi:flavin-dependent dehydrogenase